MDTPNGARDSRFLNYEMPILNENAELYGTNMMHRSTVGISRPSLCSNPQRGVKRPPGSDMYDQINRNMLNETEIIEESYSPNQKGSPLSNGKKTKGRVKIKMEYIDNKLRRYTTFSKRKTGIMKKAYELSTLTGTQVMLLVASETGHVYTFATRKLQPMITSDAGKALIQTCLNSPDPCPSGSGDQRMSATGFEETELSYNIGDDEKVDSSSCSPYRSDSSESSDAESVAGSPPSSPPPSLPPLIALQDLHTSATNNDGGLQCASSKSLTSSKQDAFSITNNIIILEENRPDVPTADRGGIRCVPLRSLLDVHKDDDISLINNINNHSKTAGNIDQPLKQSSSEATISIPSASTASSDAKNVGMVFTLEQLQREFGLTTTSMGSMPQYITIPLATMASPPAAHQTPADLSNRPRK